ncbi:CBN-NAS-13 protein [Aphelenchoides avenae]|nr:CBN-NAS-13 protein [Aphelenchus avenae]
MLHNRSSTFLQFIDWSVPVDLETVLTDEDFMELKRLQKARKWNRTDDEGRHPPRYNKLRFEGDIVNQGLNSKTIRSFTGGDTYFSTISRIEGIMRDAVRDHLLLWPAGRVPYTVSAAFTDFA